MPPVLISDDQAERDLAMRQLLRIDYDDVRGYLDGGLLAWHAAGLSVLAQRGYRDLILVKGGFAAWTAMDLPIERG